MLSKSRPRRNIKPIDYKIFGSTGQKVFIERRNLSEMEKMVDTELKITRKLARFFNEYDISLLFDVSDVENGIAELKALTDEYEDVHSQLSRISRDAGDEVYKETYSEQYDEQMKAILDWIRSAKISIKEKKEEQVSISQQEKSLEASKQKDKLIAEEKYLRGRIDSEIRALYADDSNFVEDLEKGIISAQNLSVEYSQIFVEIETCGPQFRDSFGTAFTETEQFIKTFVAAARHRIREIKLSEKQKEEKRASSAEHDKLIREEREKIVKCKVVFDNISERLLSVEKKCSVDIKNLSDPDLLTKKRELKSLDSDFHDILDRITKLSEYNPNEYAETANYLRVISGRKADLKTCISEYKLNLESEVCCRDLTEEKMKNASALGIKIPKFKGYDSVLDYYTFKSEFDKLIAPHIRANLLPDYLKNNYLEGQALQFVREIHDMDSIWKRLRESFGDVQSLLSRKMSELEKSTPLMKVKGDDKLIQSILRLKNLMSELKKLAESRNIQSSLFHTSNVAKVFALLGKKRQLELTKESLELGVEIGEDKKWDNIISYLEKEIRVREQVLLLDRASGGYDSDKPAKNAGNEKSNSYSVSLPLPKCVLCDKSDNHVLTTTQRGNSVINYFACELFATSSCAERFEILKKKKLCFQCLSPGFKAGHKGRCFSKYKCPDASHNQHRRGIHVLICDEHKKNPENISLLQTYKEKCILGATVSHANFSKNISIFHVESGTYEIDTLVGIHENRAVYMLQTIRVGTFTLRVFFDTGCYDMVVRKSAVDLLTSLGLAKNVRKGPILLSGVGDQTSCTDHGRFLITLPLYNGQNVNLSGLCLDKLTSTFPEIKLGGAERDIQQDANLAKVTKTLPKLPKSVGGDVDIMIGAMYNRYIPNQVHKMENGLAIYESLFAGEDGSRGVLLGPHQSFNPPEGSSNHVASFYFSDAFLEYRKQCELGLTCGLLGAPKGTTNFDLDELAPDKSELFAKTDTDGSKMINKVHSPKSELERISEEGEDSSKNVMKSFVKNCDDVSELKTSLAEEESDSVYNMNEFYVKKRAPKCIKLFEKAESAGTEVSYRCPGCRVCKDCIKSPRIECTSIREESEQFICDKSVTVNPEKGEVTALLPFLCDPTKRLKSNYHIAEKIYFSQVRKLQKVEKDRADVVSAFKKLIDMNYITKLTDLSKEDQNLINSSEVKYFIPWTAVWNTNSVSTPCRPVFNASCATDTGNSLNDLLPKGRNSLNKLCHIIIRWRAHLSAFHTDVQKMYNTIKLDPRHWCYQLCLFHDFLDPDAKPITFVIRTLIYGVKTSGNQAERAIRETALLSRDEFPRQNEIVQNDIYMDDCLSGEVSYERAVEVTNDLQVVLGKTNFRLKGITHSGFDPPGHLCNDDKKSVNVAGKIWFPKTDELMLNVSDPNFGKKKRGKKAVVVDPIIPESFTRTDCAGRVGQLFDLVGRFAPLSTEFKLDLRDLCVRKLDWEDTVPGDRVKKWLTNFDMISELNTLRFKRCIIPEDAVSLDMETLEMGDASLQMACSVVYVRIKRKNGKYSCQNVFAKTKIIPDGMSIPRAELVAAVLNSATGHIVKLSLGDYIKSRTHFTDSQVALCWISNDSLKLKPWARDRVVEVRRLTDVTQWRYIESKNNMADIGTRRGATIEDVLEDSPWICGQEWAQNDREGFPVKSFNDIKLTKDQKQSHDEELVRLEGADPEWIAKQLSQMYCKSYAVNTETRLDQIRLRYQFSDYLIDPNRYRFRKVVRIKGLVFLFVRKLKDAIGKPQSVIESRNELPRHLNFNNDSFLVTEGKGSFPFVCRKGLVVKLSEDNLQESLNYFYRKATLEIKCFQPKTSYERISVEKFGILYYTGRILPSQTINNKLSLSDVCIDLCTSTFCVPLVDKYSPLAFSIVNEVHWYDDDARHSGTETVMRHVQKIAHIIESRALVQKFRLDCARCRALNKKAIDVAMGPKSCENLTIAPAFYNCQVDICGPNNAYSNANKRATVKVWFVIFCCCVTGAIDIKVTEDYST